MKHREMLFRAKRLDNGEWVQGAFIPDALESLESRDVPMGYIRLVEKETNKVKQFEVDRETVGQFIGLVDKNGKKIFEGDILSDGAVVEWFNELVWDTAGSPHPGFYCKEWLEYNSKNELDYYEGFFEKTEVIGNIYDARGC